MLTNAPLIISQQRDSGRTERLAREWIVTFAELYSVSLKDRGPRFVTLWVSAVSDLDPGAFEAACSRAMQTCKFFPTPAEIRGLLDQAGAKGFDLEAEGEWQKLLGWIQENFFPDTGIRRGALRLTPAVEHAAKAAGGVHFIERCSDEQLVWCRKTFLADLKNIRETAQVEHLLGDGDAKNILAQLATGPAKADCKKLAPAPEPEGKLPPRAEVKAVLERVANIPSEDELENRRRELKRRAEKWAIEHGYSVGAGEKSPVQQLVGMS
jgi:hypothetical protein